jgi:Fe-S-cluster-containing dehydrogenase component/CRP-like cAMP-binding protein
MTSAVVKRPARWDEPFAASGSMSSADVAELLARPPFSRMVAERFPATLPLEGILRNDARMIEYCDGEVILREGDYGSSAFLILDGTVTVVLRSLPEDTLGRTRPNQVGWFDALARWWRNPSYPEVRRSAGVSGSSPQDLPRQRIFLQDIPGVLSPEGTLELHAGEIFGELAALTRTPRSASVLSKGTTRLLEIRWQGLRDLLRYDDSLRRHIDELYRNNSLRVHLRETPLLARLSPEQLDAVAAATQFATYGNFDWQQGFARLADAAPQERILAEPLIAEEGDYPDGLLLLRSGFARLSHQCDSGHRTLAYLGKGGVFGLKELVRNWRRADVQGWESSLRAVGYVDVLSIPVPVVEQIILPTLSDAELRQLVAAMPGASSPANHAAAGKAESGLLEFLVDKRYINGTAAMVIDLDRCTRCDDCVRACAATHDNNPRFSRQGEKHGRFLVAHACMHCADPVCMIGCPTGAIHRQAETGLAVINDATCVGCRTCANNCPYQNIRMVEIRNERGEPYVDAESHLPIVKATKCDLCVGQLTGPACVQACPHDALVRLDLHDANTVARWTQL